MLIRLNGKTKTLAKAAERFNRTNPGIVAEIYDERDLDGSIFVTFEKGFCTGDNEGQHTVACVDSADAIEQMKFFKVCGCSECRN